MKKTSSVFLLSVISFLTIYLSGCGYTATRVLPESIQTVSIPMFINKTQQYNIENSLSDKITEEFIIDGRLKVINQNNSDIVLEGTITKFFKQPIATDRNNNVLEYRLTLIVKLNLKDNTGNTVWERKDLNESYSYYPERQAESEALDRLLKNLSRNIVIQIIEEN